MCKVKNKPELWIFLAEMYGQCPSDFLKKKKTLKQG